MTVPGPSTTGVVRLVVGCGYLGSRVVRGWVAGGDRVVVLTRRAARIAEISALGATAIVADVVAADLGSLPEAATLFWGVGFDRTPGQTHRDIHVVGLRRLLDMVPGRPRVVFSSSTGVWGDDDGRVVDESTPAHPTREAGRVLLEAEAMLGEHPLGPGTALRFAGLYGPGRLPRLADLRAGRPIAADPDSTLNLVHVDDAARVVRAVADAAAPAVRYVVSDGNPLLRRDWYGGLAAAAGAPAPVWDPTAPRGRGSDKRVDASRLGREFPGVIRHPDALAELPALVAAESDG